MRIAILEDTAEMQSGGAERSMAMFSDYVKREHEVYLICHKAGNYSFTGEPFRDTLEVRLEPLRIQGVYSYFATVRTVAAFIKSNNINVILTHTIHAFDLLRFVKIFSKVRVVVYFKWIFTGDTIGILNAWGLRGLDQPIYINHFVGDYWQRFIKRRTGRILIPDGIQFRDTEPNGKELAEKKRLLFAGRIYPGKGLHVLIKAMALLEESYQLNVLGFFDHVNDHSQASYHRQLNDLVSQLNLRQRVIFLGFNPEIENHIKESDIVVVPSVVDDAQPLVLLEAIALNRLTLGSRRGGIPEILDEELCLFNPVAEELADKIRKLVSMNPEERGEMARRIYLKAYRKYDIRKTQVQLKQALVGC